MKRLVLIGVICSVARAAANGDPSDSAEAVRSWPAWRGPLGTGVAPHADPPVEWSEKENVRWQTALPGAGHSSPVVWGDDVFLTSAVPHGAALEPRYSDAPGAHDNLPVTHRHRFVVVSVGRRDGKIRWERTVRDEVPHEGGHVSGSLASASPVTDGKSVFAFFGSRGLYCFSAGGDLRWQKDFGLMHTKHAHGEGSSPVLHGTTLVVNWDHEEQSSVFALDSRTGDELWKVTRDEATSWASPIVVTEVEKPQIVVSGTKRIRGYDLASGDVIWECGGLSQNVVASPVAGGGMLYAGSSYEIQSLLAIRLRDARGDVTASEHVVWKRTRGTPYVPSPLLYGDALYFLRHYQNVLTRVEATTGADRPGALRLDGIGNVYASPVGAANRIYVTDRSGATLVLSHEDRPRVLALNRLDDRFSATAAVAGKEIFLRGERSLYCLARE